MLGDGIGNIGSIAVDRADLFRQVGGDVSVVTAGFTDNKQLLATAGEKHGHIFQLNSFLDVL